MCYHGARSFAARAVRLGAAWQLSDGREELGRGPEAPTPHTSDWESGEATFLIPERRYGVSRSLWGLAGPAVG